MTAIERNTEMMSRNYYLQDGVFLGLREQLESLQVVQKSQSNLRGCNKPDPGQSLRKGNFVPIGKEDASTGSGRLTDTLYYETYVCKQLHRAKAKRKRAGDDLDTLPPLPPCNFSAKASITKTEAMICTLTYPAVHTCVQPGADEAELGATPWQQPTKQPAE